MPKSEKVATPDVESTNDASGPGMVPVAEFRDPTPNENYTLAGVGQGLPTPETDTAAYDAAQVAAREASRKV